MEYGYIVTKTVYYETEEEWMRFYNKTRSELWDMFENSHNCPLVLEFKGRFSRVIGFLKDESPILNELDFVVWGTTDADTLKNGELSIEVSEVDWKITFVVIPDAFIPA